jgi:hypothetical protein
MNQDNPAAVTFFLKKVYFHVSFALSFISECREWWPLLGGLLEADRK